MNLADLRAFMGNLLDYDPTNVTYENQMTDLLNDAQTRILTDRPWSFSIVEEDVEVRTDVSVSLNCTNGSSQVTGTGFPLSANLVRPGSTFDGGTVKIDGRDYEVAYVASSTVLHLTTEFVGVSATYATSIRQRQVYMPSDTMTVEGVLDMTDALPRTQVQLSKWTRDDVQLDPDQLGTPTAFMPSRSRRVPAPRAVTGVTLATPGAGRGGRTLQVYMCNVRAPGTASPVEYPAQFSGGFESQLSPPTTFVLGDTQELSLVPETLNNRTGLYRRYYFTCTELGIDAPVRLADNSSKVDTVSPAGTVTLSPDTRLSVLQSQNFSESSVRYRTTGGVYQAFELYPHPSGNTEMHLRRLMAPQDMQEDHDVPLVPQAYAQIIAYSALEQLCLKHDNLALAQVYQRKKAGLYQAMEARYLKGVPRRIIKGERFTNARYYPNPFGPLTFTP